MVQGLCIRVTSSLPRALAEGIPRGCRSHRPSEKSGSRPAFCRKTGRRKMRRKFTIAAAALLLVGAPAQAERAERDPDKMAVIAATILIFDRDCEKVSPNLEEAAGIATEVAGKPKVAAVIMRIEDQIEKDGKEAWCALARKNFPPLTER